MKPNIFRETIERCWICAGRGLEPIWSLPNLPLTEALGQFDASFPSFDQELCLCPACGHVQLRHQLDPDFLYDPENYNYRSGGTPKSTGELTILLDFVAKQLRGRQVQHALEIGANDLSLAQRLTDVVEGVQACDPLLSQQDGERHGGVEVIGMSVERALEVGRLEQPDLIIARHTLEHIAHPRALLEEFLSLASDDCVLIFEVPSLSHLAESLRFDAVFHQHYHYFDLASFNRLALEVGAHCSDYRYNYQGSNGGSLIIALQRGVAESTPQTAPSDRKMHVLGQQLRMFERQMLLTQDLLASIDAPVFGFGAGLMLATLDYHLAGYVSNLACVYDDASEKAGMSYRNVDVEVRWTGNGLPDEQSYFLITSLESLRPIYARTLSLAPRRIVTPLIT